MTNNATHLPALSVMASAAGKTANEALAVQTVSAFFPPPYKGNTPDELSEMFRSAREKKLAVGGTSDLVFDAGDDGPLPMGIVGEDGYMFLHRARKDVICLTPPQLMSEPYLTSLAPPDFWRGLRSVKDKDGNPTSRFDVRAIGNCLMRACEAKGAYNALDVRGLGGWRENGNIVYNFRGSVPTSPKYTYVRPSSLPEADASKPIDTAFVKAWLEMFNWAKKGFGTLFFGWASLAVMCGALDWRTHLFLTGKKQTGKSTLLNGLKALLDPLAFNSLLKNPSI